MVSVPKTDSPHTAHSDQSAVGGTSDTESNSGRDNEVCMCVYCVYCIFVEMHAQVSKYNSSYFQDVFYTEAEMERRRLSSASSTSFWAPTPDWVSNINFLIYVRYNRICG